AAVLYPALKAVATGKHDKLVFVTAKTIGRVAAQDTLSHFRQAGFNGTSLSLTAKDSICLAPGKACHGDDCPYARGYYDKLPGAMQAAIARDSLAREDMEDLGRSFDVCPYELARDLAAWVDVIIGDIHYVYGLGGMLGSAMEVGNERWTVLVDEAHNLPDRARSMYSARLAKARLMAVKREAGGDVARALAAVNRQFLALDKLAWQEHSYHSTGQPPSALLHSLQGFTGAVGEELAQEPGYLQRQSLLADFYFDVLQFQRVADHWGEDFRCRLTRDSRGKQSLCVQLACLDPARLLGERHARANATVAFSATLSPLHWSRDALGLGPEAVTFRAVSPFAREQLQVSLATGISTRFRDREASAATLGARLSRWLAQRPGNCIVYFPSYAYMDMVLAHMADPATRTSWIQRPEMDEAARGELLELLAQSRDVAAFCILGGIFGEGIDLPGKQLESVAIVGVGMPQVNRDTRELQQWYEARYGHGFEYAFIFPGMQKVAQAMGRVVRNADDHGGALLIDSRYREPAYRDLLPPWWSYATD
ncbi:MAG: ATP-dependent DNA helicase, partial [Halioglobus sp.]